MIFLGVLAASFLGAVMAFGVFAGLLGHFMSRGFVRLIDHFGTLTRDALKGAR